MLEELRQCEVCPFRCKVNRLEGKIGKCGCNDKIKIALASLHYYEEPCISGKNGSGTVFFSNCNLNCIYCQNYEISQLGKGKEITIEHLAQIFIKQQEKNVNNINLVTPTMYVPQIIEAINIARYFDSIGDDQLAEYIMSLIAESNLYTPQSSDFESEFLKQIDTRRMEPLNLPIVITEDVKGIINAIANAIRVGTINTGQYFFNVFCMIPLLIFYFLN